MQLWKMNGNEQFSFYSSSHIQNFLFIPQVSSKIFFLFLKSHPKFSFYSSSHIQNFLFTLQVRSKIANGCCLGSYYCLCIHCVVWWEDPDVHILRNNTGKVIVSEVILSNTKGGKCFSLFQNNGFWILQFSRR